MPDEIDLTEEDEAALNRVWDNIHANRENLSQREFMLRLIKLLGQNEGLVVRAYADAESRGAVRRKSNKNNMSAEEYAKALWKDGEKEGWLNRQ
jgi:hypothetical protein